ncbi:hypothetical protein KSB_95160 [Ktedonobacter robiniae]|uniref:Uncharacterized protein n=2 Tax=Ktedonobacter robiniae TaxID=2778365 RepID=A0ABQ3V722_9CHLR|nr:hypothetical protein KSB_95160 [Ktedonobacter robiniae]
MLQQQVQASQQGRILVANMGISYRLELEYGYYRLCYTQVPTARHRLIHNLLAEKDITQYELTDMVDEGRMLPPYQDARIEDCSGTIVTPVKIYHFWLDWVNGQYSLGDKSSYTSYTGEIRTFWNELEAEDYMGSIKDARRRMTLRRRVENPQTDESGEMWEIREEEANIARP